MGDRGGVGGGNKLLSVEIGREGDVEETKFWSPRHYSSLLTGLA